MKRLLLLSMFVSLVVLPLHSFAQTLAPATATAATTTAPPAATPASATTTPASTKLLSAQNVRMQNCAAQYHAKNIPSSQYKTFMSSCLKTPSAGQPALAATTTAAKTPSTQQQKMASCNASAKTQHLTSDARKTFMSTCLSAKN